MKKLKPILIIAISLLLIITCIQALKTANYKTTNQETTTVEVKTEKLQYPENTKITHYAAEKKRINITWETLKDVNGYQIQYSTGKKFKKKSTKLITIKNKDKSSKRLKDLQPDTKYYIRVRTYKIIDGTRYYSDWSKTKKIKTNKTNKKWGSYFGGLR